MVREIEFNVTGSEKIHCESCEQRIGRALKRVPGVTDVNASSASQKIRVSIDLRKISAEQVRGKIRELGYEVQLG